MNGRTVNRETTKYTGKFFVFKFATKPVGLLKKCSFIRQNTDIWVEDYNI